MVMTLYKVEVRPPPGVDAEPIFAERFEAGPVIRSPIEGDRFRVRDAWGRIRVCESSSLYCGDMRS